MEHIIWGCKTVVISLEDCASEFREDLKILEQKARKFSEALKESDAKEGSDKGEYIAQSILAMRHIEDARMRYGKVIQYLGEWVSMYDTQSYKEQPQNEVETQPEG